MRVASKKISAVSLVKEALDKAKRCEKYNIFVSLNEKNALKKAKEIDDKIAAGEKVGRLAGVPYALKDNFLSPEGNTTASSKILEPLKSPITATSVAKLEAEGAIMIGRTNMDSFAHGSSTENSYFGPTHNAKDFDRVAGGSSGGSAAAVALGIVPFATGTDTGGSIRQPASFNGVYGFKPTYGTISRYGVVAMASSTDCIGFFANSPADIDLLMQICAGQDPKDMTTLPDYYGGSETEESFSSSSSPASDQTYIPDGSEAAQRMTSGRETGNSKKTSSVSRTPHTIATIKDFDNSVVAPEIRQALADKVSELKSAGHKIVELDMPTLKYALAVYYIVVPAEISSNLSRHDGIRYGYSYGRTSKFADSRTVSQSRRDSRGDTPVTTGGGDPVSENRKLASLDDIYAESRSEGFMPENKRRIMIGNFVLSSGFYDAYYLKAQKARTLIIKEYESAFKKCDFILTPVAPNPAFKLGEKTDDPVSMYLEDVMSVPINLAGLPSLAIPVGQTEPIDSAPGGLPLGLQLIGPRRSDAGLLAFAQTLVDSDSLSIPSTSSNTKEVA